MGKREESQNCEEENLVKGEVNTNTPSPSIHTTMVQNVRKRKLGASNPSPL